MRKLITCCKCKKEIDKADAIRILVQEYGAGRYAQFYTTKFYDLCKRCYSKALEPWFDRPLTKKGGGSNE